MRLEDGPIGTIGRAPFVHVDALGRVLNDYGADAGVGALRAARSVSVTFSHHWIVDMVRVPGEVYTIVHQYDRVEAKGARLQAVYEFESDHNIKYHHLPK